MLIRITPNLPAQSCSLVLRLDRPSSLKAEIFDLSGELAHQEKRPLLPAGEQQIDFSGIRLRAGSYIMKLHTNEGIISSMLHYRP